MFNLQQIANLSRLNLPADQHASLEKQLQSILSYVEQLQKVDTSQVEGYGLSDRPIVQGEDQPQGTCSRDERITLSPAHHEGLFLVPKVIGGGEES